MAEVIEPIVIVQGDRARGVSAILEDQDGSAINLTGDTVVFRMVDEATGNVKVNNQSANVDGAATGEVSYDWAANDTNTVGTYRAYFIRTTSGGLKEHFPGNDAKFKVHVIAAL